jgi:hypothetical protein
MTRKIQAGPLPEKSRYPHYFGRSVEVVEAKGVFKNVEKEQFVSD